MKFNSQTTDYTPRGIQAQPIRSLAEAAYLRLTTQKGSYFDDKAFGSELYRLKRSKDLARVREQAKRWAEDALEPLRASFYLTGITVTILPMTKGYLSITAVLTRSEGYTEQISVEVPVAG